jgi:hypothetical protein
MKNISTILALALALIVAHGGDTAVARSGESALTGVRTADVYFDVNIGEPAKLAKRLELIETTYRQLVASGFSPRAVIGIRGKASNFFTRGDGYVLQGDLPMKKAIAARLESLHGQGLAVEQCRIAAGLQEIDEADFLPQLTIVDNGYVSMIGYQAQGYAFVPMD